MRRIKIFNLIPIEIVTCQFQIDPQNIPIAYAAAKSINKIYSDINNLSEAFLIHGFKASQDEQLGIYDLTFYLREGIEALDPCIFFETIAPFVQSGSCLEFKGREGSAWRYLFTEKKVIRMFPTDFIWPAFPIEKNQFWAFHCLSRQPNWINIREHCNFYDAVIWGLYNENGSAVCEYTFKWYKVRDFVSPKLEMFIGSHPIIAKDMLKRIICVLLDLNQNLTTDDFNKILLDFGFIDLSEISHFSSIY